MIQATTIKAFSDELEKISAKKPKQSLPAKAANELFGRPAQPLPDPSPQAQGSTAAQSASRGEYPIDGQSSANISSSNTMSPATGPGGV